MVDQGEPQAPASAVAAQPTIDAAKTTAQPTQVEQTAEAAETANAGPENGGNTAGTAGQDEAAAAQRGISNPDKARDALDNLAGMEVVAGFLVNQYVEEQITKLQKSVEQGKMSQKQAREAAAKLKSRDLVGDIARLKLDKNNPLNQALGYDIEIALLSRGLESFKTADQSELSAKQKARLQKEIKDREQALKKATEARGAVKKDNQEIPNQLGELAKIVAGDEADLEKIADDPFEVITETLAEAMEDESKMQQLGERIQKAGVTEEEWNEFQKIFQLKGKEDEEQPVEKTKLQRAKNILIKGGFGISALGLLMMWLASKEKQGMAVG